MIQSSFITLKQLELATIYWYDDLDIDLANQAELRLVRGEVFLLKEAIVKYQNYLKTELNTTF